MNFFLKRSGFTLVEILVAIAIVGFISSVVILGFSSFNSNYSLEGEAQIVASLLRDARSKTLSARGGFQYGVHLSSSSAVLFRGPIYEGGNTTNEVTRLRNVIIGPVVLNGGGSDIVFSKIRGDTNSFGTTTLYLVSNPSKQKNIVIDNSGLVEVR